MPADVIVTGPENISTETRNGISSDWQVQASEDPWCTSVKGCMHELHARLRVANSRAWHTVNYSSGAATSTQ